ncbi:hypothetical protein PHYSODRAFT_251748 [Phytophthora sojae]|uniref:Uncharacterized protein n=1 Tax=Phytophthora sojae (strain P6497) TaxID=1094619 RepID=G4YXT7_PHYSP|nr:hypothetical protein PHYSODRAFT_251748 [Phytophthora sojae]EGZ25080.1 hypothetical protein PHYSODRAFT_251748 [Phytophthora sojae]|eukprot:XP_009520368.1 hypothetical protein PHYSODRAFT_251748 [Phytophthora sojae]
MPLGDTEFASTNRDGHLDDGDDSRVIERSNVERRRYRLVRLPKMYTPGHRKRYLVLSLDNIAGSLMLSNLLYERIDGATSSRDVYLNFGALTRHLSGSNLVKFQLATYNKTSPCVAHALERFGWKTKSVASADKTMYKELMGQLYKGAVNSNGKTLVLATGDGCLGTCNTNAYREIICMFLKEGWYVEIHAWLYALNNGYLRLQKEHPGRVVVKPLDDVICELAQPNERGCRPWSSADSMNKTSPTENSHIEARPYAHPTQPAYRRPVGAPEAWSQRARAPASGNASVWPASLAERLCRAPSTQHRLNPAPKATPSPPSWAAVVTEGRTPRTATPPTENSSPGSSVSDLGGFSHAEEPLSPTTFGWPPAAWRPPATPPLRPPVQTLRLSPMHSGLMWSLQLQQMQDLLSSQQADLAMRQTVLRQTTEMMRLMREQEQRWPSDSGAYRQARDPLNPWAGARGFLT